MTKPIVVLDTNVFISALFWEGKPYDVVQKALNEEIIAFISDEIIEELKEILGRDFPLEKREIEDTMDSVMLFTHLVKPKEKVNVVEEDPTDNKIIECAIACNAKFIVTKDEHLLKLKKFRNILIVSSDEFISLM